MKFFDVLNLLVTYGYIKVFTLNSSDISERIKTIYFFELVLSSAHIFNCHCLRQTGSAVILKMYLWGEVVEK